MANVKISELTDAGAITGTEEVPVVQGGVTKRASVADIIGPHEADTTSVHGIANTANLATQAYVTAAVDALVSGAPGALDTLNELAAAINDDASFAATVTTALAAKASTDSLNTHAADTSSVHGVTDTTALLTEPTHDALDHTGLTGVGTEAIVAHEAAADPHTGYVRESLIDAAADLIVGTAADTVGRLAKGSALQVLRVNAGATALEYADLSGTSVWTQIVNLPGTTLTGWTSLGGTWAANAGGYIEQTDTTAAYRGLRLDTDVIVGASLVVQAEMRFPSDATADRRCMLSFAGEGTIASSHDPWVGLVENTDTLHVQRGNATALNTASTVNEDVWYTVRGELCGWLLTISVDGVYQATYRLGGATATTEVQTNRLSLVTYQGPVHYRNIKAWRMVGPT